MKRKSFLVLVIFVLVSACGPSPEKQATQTAEAQTATAAIWTKTPTSTSTATYTFTPTLTLTPTITYTPTITFTPSITPSPTYDFPKVTVNVANAACLYGPSTAYLWARDLRGGDTGLVWGRAPVGNWLYVKIDRWDIPCWVSPYVVDVVGDISKMLVQKVNLPTTNALYAPPTGVDAVRNGDQVTIGWDPVWMTEDDDRGYFLDLWVCQGGNYVWSPKSFPNQYNDSYTITDERGCSAPSKGLLYTVEKHGYTDPVTIPWPP